MERRFVYWFVMVFVLAASLAWTRAVPRAEESRLKSGEDQASRKSENPIVAMARKLNQKADLPPMDNPKTTLADALDVLSKKYDISFEVNEDALHDALKQGKGQGRLFLDVMNTPIAVKTPIPGMKQISLERALRRVLGRIPKESGACFVVRKNHIEITTQTARYAEFWPNGEENPRGVDLLEGNPGGEAPKPPPLPLVIVEFEETPLKKALGELASASGYNIVLDPRAGEQGKVPVTASLINVPLDTAVRMLADMADLKPVLLNNAIYVTTDKRAHRFRVDAAQALNGGMGGFGQLRALGQLGGFVGQQGGFGCPRDSFNQPTSIRVDNKPLADSLEELTAGRKVQVLFDKNRIGPNGANRLTAELNNVSLETAIRLLVDMADLFPVFIDNVAYVTTRDHGQRLVKEKVPTSPSSAELALENLAKESSKAVPDEKPGEKPPGEKPPGEK